MLNSNASLSKKSTIEKILNQQFFLILKFQVFYNKKYKPINIFNIKLTKLKNGYILNY